ncbi:transaldolase family protein [Labedella endophytica]|uniref:transaldolase family protein n=1 Tax=Labedella endophytica TaxID=1523160 RepID=UPI00140B9E80|nr:transaldolase family protein [Labedella endophytica]
MKIYADSARLDVVLPLLERGLLAGVTTNPTILHRDGFASADRAMLHTRFAEAGAQEIFLQAVGSDEASMRADAEALAALGPDVVVKVPATSVGFPVGAALAAQGTPVLVTAVYSVGQAAVAASIGAAYIAPYLGRLADSVPDPLDLVGRMDAALDGSGTRTLLASVRSVEAAERAVTAGIRHLTADVPVIVGLMSHDVSDASAAEFERVAAL